MDKLKRLLPRDSKAFRCWRAFLKEFPEDGLRVDTALCQFAHLYFGGKGVHFDDFRPLSEWGRPKKS